MHKYTINTPRAASESGIAIIEFSETPPLLEQIIKTIKIDDVIVAVYSILIFYMFSK